MNFDNFETLPTQYAIQSAHVVSNQASRRHNLNTEETLLVWLFKWGYSIEKIASFVAGSTPEMQRGLLARMAKKGLTKRVEAPRSRARYIYLLTNSGKEKARSLIDSDLRYDCDPARVNHSKVNHSLAIQFLTSQNIANMDKYMAEREILGQFVSGKIADSVWVLAGKKICIESELESKSGPDLDKMLVGLCEAIDCGNFYAAIIFITNNDRAKRYQARINDTLDQWLIKPGQKPHKIGQYTASEEVRRRIHFCVVPDLMESF